MNAQPNTSVDILGQGGGDPTPEYDEHGDPIESEDPESVLATDVPASIVEGRTVTTTEADQDARVITYHVMRLPAGTAVDRSQRVRDRLTGTVYVVDRVSIPHTFTTPADVRVDMHTSS